MPIEIWCALISAVVSLAVSLITAKWDHIKMKLGWARQDRVSADDAFAEMAAAVSSYVLNPIYSYRSLAATKVAAVRTRESGATAERLDELYALLLDGVSGIVIDAALTRVIDEKRDQRRRAEANTKKLAGS